MIRGTDLIEKLSDQMEGYYSSAAEERQEIAALEQKLAALTLKRTNLFLDFAEHEIATDDTKNLVRVLGDSALKVQEMIDHRRKRLGEIEAEIKQKSQQLEATKQTLKEAEDRRTKAVEAEKAAFAEAEKLANADSAVIELEQKLAPVCAKRTVVERRLAEGKKNWEDKKGAYDNDAIFSYLRKRAESEKPGGNKGLFEKVDGWLAQQTGFAESLTHYNELKELPTLLTGFLDKWKAEEQVLREQYGQARSRIIKAYKPREETEAISLKAKEVLKQAVAQRASALAELQKLNTEHQLLLAQKDPDFLNAKGMLAEAIQKFGSAATQMPIMQQVQNEASKIGDEIDRLRTNVKAHRNRLQQLTDWTQRTAQLKATVEERNWNRRRVLFDDSVVTDSSIQQTVINNLNLLALVSLWEQNHTIQQEVSHSYRHDNSWGSFGGGSSSSSSWGSSSSSSDSGSSGSWSTSSSDSSSSSSGSWSTSDSV